MNAKPVRPKRRNLGIGFLDNLLTEALVSAYLSNPYLNNLIQSPEHFNYETECNEMLLFCHLNGFGADFVRQVSWFSELEADLKGMPICLSEN